MSQSVETFNEYIEKTLLVWFIYRFYYIINLGFVKVSILIFYYVLAIDCNFRATVHASMAVVVLYSFIMVTANIFACKHFTDSFEPGAFLVSIQTGVPLRCFDSTVLWFTQAGLNLITDIIILVIPMPYILRLHVPYRKKVALICVFGVGMIAIFASVVRVYILTVWSATALSQPQHQREMLMFGQLEINSGIISASIPFLRPLFRKFFAGKEQDGDVVEVKLKTWNEETAGMKNQEGAPRQKIAVDCVGR
jgi:hypothetical protein